MHRADCAIAAHQSQVQINLQGALPLLQDAVGITLPQSHWCRHDDLLLLWLLWLPLLLLLLLIFPHFSHRRARGKAHSCRVCPRGHIWWSRRAAPRRSLSLRLLLHLRGLLRPLTAINGRHSHCMPLASGPDRVWKAAPATARRA
jgi:hypothetical protein